MFSSEFQLFVFGWFTELLLLCPGKRRAQQRREFPKRTVWKREESDITKAREL